MGAVQPGLVGWLQADHLHLKEIAKLGMVCKQKLKILRLRVISEAPFFLTVTLSPRVLCCMRKSTNA